jgi:hypothetical protein
MAGIITTGNHPKALWPGINAWFGVSYKERPVECTMVFDEESSEKAYEEDVEASGFGLAPVKQEGTAVSYDSHTQGYTKRYTHVAYALGYIVTKEELADNLYEKVSKSRARSLAFSMRQTKEVIGANIFNNGFDTNYTGGDGKPLFSATHTSLNGSWSNLIAVAADLSEASLEDQFINIMNATNSRGLKIALTPRKLIVPPNEAFNATRIVKSELQNDTANNAINAIRSMGLLPEGVMVWHYLSDTDAWFVKTDCPEGLKYMSRAALEFTRRRLRHRKREGEGLRALFASVGPIPVLCGEVLGLDQLKI